TTLAASSGEELVKLTPTTSAFSSNFRKLTLFSILAATPSCDNFLGSPFSSDPHKIGCDLRPPESCSTTLFATCSENLRDCNTCNSFSMVELVPCPVVREIIFDSSSVGVLSAELISSDPLLS